MLTVEKEMDDMVPSGTITQLNMTEVKRRKSYSEVVTADVTRKAKVYSIVRKIYKTLHKGDGVVI